MKDIKTIKHMDEISQLGDYHLLTGSKLNSTLKLSVDHHKNVAILGNITNKECLILVAPGKYPSQSYLIAGALALRNDFSVSIYHTERSILKIIYSKEVAVEERSVTQADKRLFDNIMTEAVERNVSEVMFFQTGHSECKALFEINTIASGYKDYTHDEVNGMMQYFYTKVADQSSVEDPIFRYDSAQFAAGDGNWAGHRTRLRFQSKPTFPNGTDFSLRIINMSRTNGFNSFDDLNLPPAQKELLRITSMKLTGAIIFGGKTSSGKTTTAKIILETMGENNPGIVIRSLESPPEYIIKYVRQHAVKDTKVDGSSSLEEDTTELMRMNPDYLFLGEVRGKQSGNLFLHMQESGHGVLTSLHTTNVFGVYSRLGSQGVPIEKVTGQGAINALIYQTRVAVSCKCCRTAINKETCDEKVFDRLSILKESLSDVFFANRKGCAECNYTGYSGSSVVYDIVRPTIEMGQMALENDEKGFNNAWVAYCKENDLGNAAETHFFHAIRLVLEGSLCPLFLENTYGELSLTALNEETRTWSNEGGFDVNFS